MICTLLTVLCVSFVTIRRSHVTAKEYKLPQQRLRKHIKVQKANEGWASQSRVRKPSTVQKASLQLRLYRPSPTKSPPYISPFSLFCSGQLSSCFLIRHQKQSKNVKSKLGLPFRSKAGQQKISLEVNTHFQIYSTDTFKNQTYNARMLHASTNALAGFMPATTPFALCSPCNLR